MRRLTYPDYNVVADETGDVFLRFVMRESRFGSVEIVLVLPDAEAFADLLDKAVAQAQRNVAEYQAGTAVHGDGEPRSALHTRAANSHSESQR